MSVQLKAPAPRGRGRARVVPQRPHPAGDRKIVALRLAGGAVVLWGLFYRGMHYPSDVLAGALTGGLWLLLVITTLLPRQGAMKRGDGHPALR
jgi:membrane-associated phospholipid phosphatase